MKIIKTNYDNDDLLIGEMEYDGYIKISVISGCREIEFELDQDDVVKLLKEIRELM